MRNKKHKSKKDGKKSVSKKQKSDSQSLTLLRDIKDGIVNPKSICPVDRRTLVAILVVEGQSTAEIALLLETSDRTIERDRKAIRDEDAMEKDIRLVEKIAGMIYKEAGQCVQRIRKFQHDKNASSAAKIDGEQRCFQIICQLSERLQSFGFLPNETKRIEANLKHSAASPLSLKEIQIEAKRLRNIKTSLSINKRNKVKSKFVKRRGRDYE